MTAPAAAGAHEVTSIEVRPVLGLPEIEPGDDLGALIAKAAAELADGDILLVTSKIVSKAEGRLLHAADREAAIDAEAVRLVARRRPRPGCRRPRTS